MSRTDQNREPDRSGTELLRVENLSWTPPGESLPVFSGLELEIYGGDRLVLQGRSGAGKTSVLRCLVHLEAPGTGTVSWRQQPVGPENIREFRRRVVYLQQRPSPVADTVGEELAFARRMTERAEARQGGLNKRQQINIMERLGLKEVKLEQPFEQVSVGQQQRIAVVRALTLQPDVLLLDEPTSSLDPESVRLVENHLVQYIEQRPEMRAYLWVTHSSVQVERLQGRVLRLSEVTGDD